MPPVSQHNDVDVFPSGPWPAHFGDVRDEFAALRSTCGVYILGNRARFRLTGNDRTRWLNGMITNNVRDLALNHGVYAFLLSPQGHILGDLTGYNRGEHILVNADREQAQKILATFEHYIIMDDVEIEDVSDKLTTVGVAGPQAESVFNAAGFNVPQAAPLEIIDSSWQQVPLTFVRGDTEPYLSFEIWIAPENAARLLKALQAAGATPVGRDALELYRVALGVPRYGQDIRERDLPQETEQQRALNFNKGCYVGQEIVERIRSRGAVHRKFSGLMVDGLAPQPGTKVQLQAKDVGEITSSALIPTPGGEQAVALGYFRREIAAPGKELEIGGSRAIVSDLPFHGVLKK
jgi:folate-binding protein YgfZ